MVDVLRAVRVGDLSEATEIKGMVQGQVSIDLPNVGATWSIASASAAFPGLTAEHKVLVMPTTWLASSAVNIVAATGIEGGLQITAMNASGGAVNVGALTYNFFAFR